MGSTFKNRVRQATVGAVSKGALLEVPGSGALSKAPLEVSPGCVEARLGTECDETRVIVVHKWGPAIDERSLFIDCRSPLMCSDQGCRSTF